MKIRQGKIEDIEQIVDIVIQTSNIHYENRRDIFKKKTRETIKEWMKSEIESEDKNILIVEENEEILGVLIYKIRDVQEHINLNDTKNIWIDEICVDEKHRSQGIGKFLMDEIKKIAKEIGCKRIELNCWEFNNRARKFYEENGLTTQRRIMEVEILEELL